MLGLWGSYLLFVADQPAAVTHHEPPGEFVRFAPRLNHARDYLDRDALLGDLAGVEARLMRVGRGECVIKSRRGG